MGACTDNHCGKKCVVEVRRPSCRRDFRWRTVNLLILFADIVSVSANRWLAAGCVSTPETVGPTEGPTEGRQAGQAGQQVSAAPLPPKQLESAGNKECVIHCRVGDGRHHCQVGGGSAIEIPSFAAIYIYII